MECRNYRDDIVNYLREHGSASKDEIRKIFSGNYLDFELDILVDKSRKSFENGGSYRIDYNENIYYYICK